MSGAYEFNAGFQEKILSMAWRLPQFYLMYNDCIKPQYFEQEIHIDVARIITTYYEKYKNSPTLEVVLEEVRVLCSNSKVKKEKFKDYITTVERLVDMDLMEQEYVKDKVVEFGKKQALTDAILKSVEDIQKGNDFDKVKRRIDDAVLVGEGIEDLGLDYFTTIEQRIDDYDEEEVEKIPTGVDSLDKLMHGGLGRGELGIVIAPPGTGKTLTLVNFGVAAILHNKNVVHLSLEMNEKIMAKRYDMRFTEKDKEYIVSNKAAVKNSLALLAKARKSKLRIKSFPTRTLTVEGLRNYLSRLKTAEGFVPDLIIVDYPDIMRPSRDYGEKRHELELLYEELRAVATEFNSGMWGASQTNRGALNKKVVTIADLAESFGKAAVADFMIALSQTKKEKRNNEVRYFIAKHRNGMSGDTLCMDIFYDIMKITSNAERQASFDMEDNDEDDDYDDSNDRSYRKSKGDKDTMDRRKSIVEKMRKEQAQKEEAEDSVASAVIKIVKEDEK